VGRRLTYKGTIDGGSQLTDFVRINLDNGDFEKNFRVVFFEVYGNTKGNPSGFYSSAIQPDNVFVTLALDSDGLGFQQLDDNRQFAWWAGHGQSTVSNFTTIVDPNHVIIQDMYIGAYAVDNADGSINPTPVELQYVIHLEEIKTTENEAVLHLIKEVQQDDRN
jgi:hypothetical protein